MSRPIQESFVFIKKKKIVSFFLYLIDSYCLFIFIYFFYSHFDLTLVAYFLQIDHRCVAMYSLHTQRQSIELLCG
jgi:hypothetical protein